MPLLEKYHQLCSHSTVAAGTQSVCNHLDNLMRLVNNCSGSLGQLMASPQLGIVVQQMIPHCVSHTCWDLHVLKADLMTSAGYSNTVTFLGTHLTSTSIFHEGHVAQSCFKDRELRSCPCVQLSIDLFRCHLQAFWINCITSVDLRRNAGVNSACTSSMTLCS